MAHSFAAQFSCCLVDHSTSQRVLPKITLYLCLQLGSKGYGDPVTFDNAYYTALLKKPWDDPSNSMASMIGLPSDHVLPDDPVCRPAIEAYAASQQQFFQDFSDAYRKLTMLGAIWM